MGTPKASQAKKTTSKPEYLVRDWRNGVLVLISVRLGLNKVQAEYFESVMHYFRSQLNVGIIGGRPKEAYYLLGMQEQSFIFLDPHHTKDAIPCDRGQIERCHLDYHEGNAKKIHFTKVDPSMTFGFYIRDHKDYMKFE